MKKTIAICLVFLCACVTDQTSSTPRTRTQERSQETSPVEFASEDMRYFFDENVYLILERINEINNNLQTEVDYYSKNRNATYLAFLDTIQYLEQSSRYLENAQSSYLQEDLHKGSLELLCAKGSVPYPHDISDRFYFENEITENLHNQIVEVLKELDFLIQEINRLKDRS